MSLSIRIRRDLVGTTDKLNRMVQVGQIALVNQVAADTDKFVPKKSGDLRIQSQIASDYKSISWNTPYARRQYYNVGAKFTTPGTYARWDTLALAVHGNEWRKIVRKAMRRV